jgi:protease II
MSAHERVHPQIRSQGYVSPPSEPRAEQRPLVRNLHGTRLTDEFAWLKDPNWREVMRDPQQLDAAIRAYLQAENDYCEHALADNTTLQEALFAEMNGRIKEDDSTVPDPDGPFAYMCAIARTGSIRCFAGNRATAGLNSSSLMAMRSRAANLPFGSAPRAIRPTIGCSRGRPMNLAPSSTLLVCA